MAGVAHIMGCCGRPCLTCGVSQPSCTVTITGSCGIFCGASNATLEFTGFLAEGTGEQEGMCRWDWQAEPSADEGLWILYDRAAESWSAEMWTLLHGFGPADVSDDVSCDSATGYLAGSFSLAGYGGATGCTGCTANITLNP